MASRLPSAIRAVSTRLIHHSTSLKQMNSPNGSPKQDFGLLKHDFEQMKKCKEKMQQEINDLKKSNEAKMKFLSDFLKRTDNLEEYLKGLKKGIDNNNKCFEALEQSLSKFNGTMVNLQKTFAGIEAIMEEDSLWANWDRFNDLLLAVYFNITPYVLYLWASWYTRQQRYTPVEGIDSAWDFPIHLYL